MKVSKNSFRPPPQVESSVVRITPLNPPPEVRFEEFDGLGRIVFSRRNKTIRSSFFGAKGVVEMLEANWKTWCAEREMVSIALLDIFFTFLTLCGRALTLGVCGLFRQPVDSSNFSERVDKILQESGYADSRAAKMDIDDLLK